MLSAINLAITIAIAIALYGSDAKEQPYAYFLLKNFGLYPHSLYQ